ncbi:MAG: universal stress protein [Desulfomonile tiedjei]|uniref:Universal stress protein n=1 Tax=Desulfomonile tiedjei TaxID=2358 RepID=A0A9D6Z602_9BACT|nr:universal stress protein [Desulfomonile tiedjei]
MVPRRIICCTDFSYNSEPARELAVDYAKAFGARLTLVHVIDSSLFPTYVDWLGDEIDQILARTKEAAETKLQEIANKCGDLSDIKTCCEIGSPAEKIVGVANDEAADLIVVGTHGHTGVKHLVMGSIARSVLRTAHRPVLIVEASPLG